MEYRTVLIACLSIFLVGMLNPVHAQKDHTQQLYVISNLEALSANAPEFTVMEDILRKETGKFTLLINGDFVDEDGFNTPARSNETVKIDRLINLVGDNGRVVFIPGDREWANGAKEGYKKVKALEEYILSKNRKKVSILPSGGCLGVESMKIGKNLKLVTINSQWFEQEIKRPDEEDTKCGVLNEIEFWDALDDELADSDNRNVVVAMHHPALSYGQYAGYKLGKQHFLPPIIGSMIASYHQNVGNGKDLSSAGLKHFANELKKKSARRPGVIFVSGHEYDIQVMETDGNYHINSGAFANGKPVAKGREMMYRQSEAGFAKLIFDEDGTVKVQAFSIANKRSVQKTYEQTLFTNPCVSTNDDSHVNNNYNPCLAKIDGSIKAGTFEGTGTAVAGDRYTAGPLKKMIMGKHYRTSWTQPVQVPFLDLDGTAGGLVPYGKGGAAQTLSLKFEAANGERYAFRSVDKEPTRRTDKELAQGVYGKIVQDLTTHQHPYGSAIVTSMMDAVDLPHSGPKLFLMPDSPKLGPFRKEFAGLLGWLELKPLGKDKGRAVFKDADAVVSTFQMYRTLLADHDSQVDVATYLDARVFDMFVSDWDRHKNNWKWLGYKNASGEGFTYKPFPKDRDKALSIFNGLPSVMDWEFVGPDIANFKASYKGLKSLNFKNRSMDRFLGNRATYEDWMNAARKLQRSITDQVISDAISTMPKEVQPLTRERITRVLKFRRDQLTKAIEEYYGRLAKYIDIPGSNEREYFEVNRLQNGDVNVKVFKMHKDGEMGDKIYDRNFKKSETEEIRLHGLSKQDEFKISGQANQSILVRVIGGNAEDKVIDNSKVSGGKRMTLVYDKRGKDKLTLNGEAQKAKTPNVINFESEDIYSDNSFVPLPSLSYNADDGFGVGFGGIITTQGFNKPGFAQRYNFGVSGTTNGNFNVNLDAKFRHAVNEWDLQTGIEVASNDRTFRNFYGLGNETIFDDALDANEYYRNNTSSVEAYLGLSRTFWQKSTFDISLLYDSKDVQPAPLNGEGETIYDDLPMNNGLGKANLLGPSISLDLDFKDDDAFPTRGMEFKFKNYTFWNGNLDWESGGRLETEMAGYITKGRKLPVTLSLKGGLNKSYGTTPFYYKSFLGQQVNHRGFRRNRFGGTAAAYLNTDLRLHFGTVVTPIVPIKYGIFGLYDVGRVWVGEEDSDTWHRAYGGGIYIIPYKESLNLTFTVARSDEESLLFSFRIGFFVK